MYEVGGARPKMYVENPMLWDMKAYGIVYRQVF